jgi:hypothetical protein
MVPTQGLFERVESLCQVKRSFLEREYEYDRILALPFATFVMKNIVGSVFIGHYAVLAALCPFRLFFKPRTGFAFFYPERVLPLEQDAVLFVGRPFSARFSRSKPRLPWSAGPNLGLAAFGRSSPANMVLSSQDRPLDTGILFKR